MCSTDVEKSALKPQSSLRPTTLGWLPVEIHRPSCGSVKKGRFKNSASTALQDILEHDVNNLQGMEAMSYGTLYWSEDELSVRGETATHSISFPASIDRVEAYPGGTGLIYDTEGTVHVTQLKEATAPITVFEGSEAEAGRLTPAGAPVLVLVQGNAVICYQL